MLGHKKESDQTTERECFQSPTGLFNFLLKLYEFIHVYWQLFIHVYKKGN